jgi:MFS family permease
VALEDASSAPSLRLKLAVYATGMFSFTQGHVVTVAVPLWALTLDPSPSLLGFIIGSRHIPALIFGIHAGILMDRFGARRVLLVCAITGMVAALAFPLLPWIPALIFLQMV